MRLPLRLGREPHPSTILLREWLAYRVGVSFAGTTHWQSVVDTARKAAQAALAAPVVEAETGYAEAVAGEPESQVRITSEVPKPEIER